MLTAASNLRAVGFSNHSNSITAIRRSAMQPGERIRLGQPSLHPTNLCAPFFNHVRLKSFAERTTASKRDISAGAATVAKPAPSRTSGSNSTGSGNIVDCSVYVDKDFEKAKLEIWIKDSVTGKTSEPVCISEWDHEIWDRASSGNNDGAHLAGRLPLGPVTSPGALFVTYNGPQSNDPKKRNLQASKVFIGDIILKDEAFGEVKFSVRSSINAVQTENYGGRVFFTDEALLPKDTPSKLRVDRKADLDCIKGLDQHGHDVAEVRRMPADRIQDFDLYNDLGNATEKRPILGGITKGLPYPRRLKTNRGLNPDGTEVDPKGQRWVPTDKDFDATKQGSFVGATKLALAPLLTQQLNQAGKRMGPLSWLLGWWSWVGVLFIAVVQFKDSPTKAIARGLVGGFWTSFDEVIDIYDNAKPKAAMLRKANLGHTDDDGNDINLTQDEKDAETRKAISTLPAEEKKLILEKVGIEEADFDAREKIVSPDVFAVIRKYVNTYLEWPEPYVYKGQHTTRNASDHDGCGRPEAWSTDEEFGRQYKAGMNPFGLTAMTSLPAQDSVLSSHLGRINKHMQGNTLEGLLKEAASGASPRLYIVDYERHIADCAAKVNQMKQDRCLYAGRCVFYERDDTTLVPVAIELHAPNTFASERVVYTPSDPSEVWLLAKAAFNNIDSGVHQLVSHWLRTHACVEPYIIATDRNLSQLHPVYKLLQPHLQYTLRINADARSSLINANGIVELIFTSGTESIQLSAAAYQDWQFKDQAFPTDVVNRGLAKPVQGGGIEIVAKDHPWCEDGLLIWNALETYTSDYVALFYKNDRDVVSDPELSAWWDEIREKGHPDAKSDGWPPMKTRADLAHILCTIAWTTSGHHASVNFGQADYSSMPLNRTTLFRKPIPAKGSSDYKKLTNPKTFEKEYLKYTANQLPGMIGVTVVELLSTHNENEHYLSDHYHKYIPKQALSVHEKLLEDLAKAEATINDRNTNGESKARTVSLGGLPYQLLLPSGVDGQGDPLPRLTTSGQRIANKPGRGIPFSISI